jgi:hypothetical protein
MIDVDDWRRCAQSNHNLGRLNRDFNKETDKLPLVVRPFGKQGQSGKAGTILKTMPNAPNLRQAGSVRFLTNWIRNI